MLSGQIKEGEGDGAFSTHIRYDAYRIFFGKFAGRGHMGRPTRKWQDIIKMRALDCGVTSFI
jgi:hypothetical protein